MSESNGSKPKVLIVGGGVAGLETALGLRDICGHRVALEMLAPSVDFTYRPLAVAAPFGLTPSLKIDLAEVAFEKDVALRFGSLERVDVRNRRVLSSSGDWLFYDYLVIATGAVPEKPLRDALSFVGFEGMRQFSYLLYRLERGEVQRIVFSAGASVGWFLPLYELALMTATFAKARNLTPEMTVVTQESSPLAVFGGRNSADVARLLTESGVDVMTGRYPVRFEDGRLQLVPEGVIETDEVVALPALRGPDHPGLPADQDGFIPTEPDGRIARCEREFAAGDVTNFPVKQGGIAAQMAGAVARSIAKEVGALEDARPFRPTLDGTLLTGRAAHKLHQSLTMGTTETSRHHVRGIWLPIAKIAAPYLGAYLAEHYRGSNARGELEPDELAGDLKEDWERRVIGWS